MKKKWIVPGIKKNSKFCRAGRIILRKKLIDIKKLAKKYLKDDSIENLHDLRIAFRRFRYSLENYYICFEHKGFMSMLSHSKQLQDALGEVRDLDVLTEKVIKISYYSNSFISKSFYEYINNQNKNLRRDLSEEINQFLNNPHILKLIKEN